MKGKELFGGMQTEKRRRGVREFKRGEHKRGEKISIL